MDFIAKFLNALVKGDINPKKTTDIKQTNNRWGRLASVDDKGTKRSISYKLTIEHDFAYGYAKDHKKSCEIKFNSHNNDKNLSRAEITRIKAMMRARQAAEDVAIGERHRKIAERSAFIWSKALSTGITPYLERKRIGLNNARIIGDKLIVPIYGPPHGTDLVNWQMIRADGTKKFQFGGQKQGCWTLLGQINPMEPFYLCEGWATGATVHETTGQAVIVAFDAGNMIHVAKSLRKIYNNTPIIIAADNDKSGVGQNAAETVRKAIGNCTVIFPAKPDTDFNDDPSGLKTSKNPADGNLPQLDDGSVQSIGGDWISMMTVDAKNRHIPHSLNNAILTIAHSDDFNGVFVYDDFRQNILVKRCPVYEDSGKFQLREINERDFTLTEAALEKQYYSLMMSADKTKRAIEVVARKNSINSAQEYFKSLEWDGEIRLETFLRDYMNCTEDDDYLSWVGTKWMTAAMKRIFEPGCKFDHILILESHQQGFYKSAALKELVTFNGETFHTDSISVLNIDSTYTPLKMVGMMIIELAELSGFSKKDDELIKNWITQTEDRVKLPFDRVVTSFKRQFIFAATSNKTDYLKDPTGNRRYWPATVGRPIDIEKIRQDAPLLWAEAYWNYKQGMYIGPTPEEETIADRERNKRLDHDIYTDRVLLIIERKGLASFRIEEIIESLSDIQFKDRNEILVKRIKKILLMNGYVNEPVWNGLEEKTERRWKKK